jgi:hypothetical protein
MNGILYFHVFCGIILTPKTLTMKQEKFILNEETGRIIGIGIEIHKTLGAVFLEIVYKDAF